MRANDACIPTAEHSIVFSDIACCFTVKFRKRNKKIEIQNIIEIMERCLVILMILWLDINIYAGFSFCDLVLRSFCHGLGLGTGVLVLVLRAAVLVLVVAVLLTTLLNSQNLLTSTDRSDTTETRLMDKSEVQLQMHCTVQDAAKCKFNKVVTGQQTCVNKSITTQNARWKIPEYTMTIKKLILGLHVTKQAPVNKRHFKQLIFHILHWRRE